MLGGHSGGRCVPLWPDWHCLPRAFNPLLRFVHFSLPGTHMFSKVFQLQQSTSGCPRHSDCISGFSTAQISSRLPNKFPSPEIQSIWDPAIASIRQHEPASTSILLSRGPSNKCRVPIMCADEKPHLDSLANAKWASQKEIVVS